jgi:hypothetical protein
MTEEQWCDKRTYLGFLKWMETTATKAGGDVYATATILEYNRSVINGALRYLQKKYSDSSSAFPAPAASFFKVLTEEARATGAGTWLQIAEANLERRDILEKLELGREPVTSESTSPLHFSELRAMCAAYYSEGSQESYLRVALLLRTYQHCLRSGEAHIMPWYLTKVCPTYALPLHQIYMPKTSSTKIGVTLPAAPTAAAGAPVDLNLATGLLASTGYLNIFCAAKMKVLYPTRYTLHDSTNSGYTTETV